MSFLTRTTLRTPARFSIPTSRAIRPFSSTVCYQKTPTESIKDGLKTVDRAVSDKLVDGLEAGETVVKKTKDTTGVGSAADAKAKASEMAGDAKGKAKEMTGEVKAKASELSGEAKGKANEVKGKM